MCLYLKTWRVGFLWFPLDEISMQCIAQLNTHKVNVIAFDTVQAGVTANLKANLLELYT
jgi:hypothetical protein